MLLYLRLWQLALLDDRLRQVQVEVWLRQEVGDCLRWAHHYQFESANFGCFVSHQL